VHTVDINDDFVQRLLMLLLLRFYIIKRFF